MTCISLTKAKFGEFFIDTITRAADEANRKAQKTAYWPVMETITRIDYGACGLINITMGFLAVKVALVKGSALAALQEANIAFLIPDRFVCSPTTTDLNLDCSKAPGFPKWACYFCVEFY
jgi:hypothetical protein